ncbi:2-amino-3-ketobutyrate coenzyme A ligase [subsurface metagenome]
MVATDGVFSMNGNIAKLDEICELADKYDAMVMIDDAHSTGFLGKTGRGTPEYRGVMGRIDIITGTLGKALGGASGGFISGRKELIEFYRQRSRPYLFSNTLAPVVVGASIAVFDLLSETTELRDKLEDNTKYFREKMTEAGFDIHPESILLFLLCSVNLKMMPSFLKIWPEISLKMEFMSLDFTFLLSLEVRPG